MNKRILGVLCIAVAVVLGVLIGWRLFVSPEDAALRARAAVSRVSAPKSADTGRGRRPAVSTKSAAHAPSAAGGEKRLHPDKPALRAAQDLPDITEADGEMIDAIHRFLEEEDFDGCAAVSDEIRATKNPSVREEYVRVLGWFGERALSDLLPFIEDADENVALEARSQWMDAYHRAEDAKACSEYLKFALLNVRNGEFLAEVASEVVSMEEQTAVEIVLATVASASPAGRKTAQEIYEQVTGNRWQSEEAARTWLASRSND